MGLKVGEVRLEKWNPRWREEFEMEKTESTSYPWFTRARYSTHRFDVNQSTRCKAYYRYSNRV